MVQELVTRTWCDKDHDAKVDATPHAVTIDSMEFEVDLCPNDEGLILTLLDLLTECGRPLNSKAKARVKDRGLPSAELRALVPGVREKTFPCPACRGEYAPNDSGKLQKHLTAIHSLTTDETFGNTCVVCG